MIEFQKAISITNDKKVKLAQEFKDVLNKELALGMTRFVCRNGTLSDGHEKITAAQRYYQSIKEMYTRGVEMVNLECLAMEYQADVLDAEKALGLAQEESAKLRAEAKLKRSKNQLINTLVNIEDTYRQLDEFDKVRLELKDEVTSKYPEGIEQAELDNWHAVAEYRASMKHFGQNVSLNHIPLPIEDKAKFGFFNGIPEMMSWLVVNDKEKILNKTGGDIKAYLSDKFKDIRLIK